MLATLVLTAPPAQISGCITACSKLEEIEKDVRSRFPSLFRILQGEIQVPTDPLSKEMLAEVVSQASARLILPIAQAVIFDRTKSVLPMPEIESLLTGVGMLLRNPRPIPNSIGFKRPHQ